MKNLKEQIKKEDEELEEIEGKIKSELKEVTDSIRDKKNPFTKDKSILKQIILGLTGIFYYIIGFTLYYLLKDKKDMRWEANILLKCSFIGLVLDIIITISEVVPNIVNKFN